MSKPKKTKKTKSDDPSAIARLFERFALTDYASVKFTDALYRPLCHAFDFIAHFDRAGFYAARFSGLSDRVETLRTMTAPTPWPWAATPLEEALRLVVVECDLLDTAIVARDKEVERVERAELARLKTKYETARL